MPLPVASPLLMKVQRQWVCLGVKRVSSTQLMQPIVHKAPEVGARRFSSPSSRKDLTEVGGGAPLGKIVYIRNLQDSLYPVLSSFTPAPLVLYIASVFV